MLIQKNVLRQTTAVLPVTLLYFLSGIGCGWVSPILNRFKNSHSDFSLTTEACSLIACLHYVGRAIGCTMAAMLVNKVGRNKGFILHGIISCIVWLAVLSTKVIPLHYAMRVVFGTGSGILEFTSPLYIGENCWPKLRGIFSSVCTLQFYLGELVMFVVGTYFSYATIAITNLTFSLVVTLTMLLLQEPAQYLLQRKEEELAEKRFFDLRGDNDNAKKEFEETKQQLMEKKAKLGLYLLGNRGVRAAIIVNLTPYITGYPVINAMSSLILSSTSDITPNELTIMIGVIQLLSVFLTPAIIERQGRRSLLMISLVISFISHMAIVALFVCEKQNIPIPHSPWLLFGFMTTYSIIVAAIFFPVSSTIRGELMSPQLKPIGGCLAIIMNSIISVLSSGVFLGIAEKYGIEMNFLFFAAVSAAMLLYTYVDLPETRGLTLTEIQTLLKK